MAYASTVHVNARCPNRAFTATSLPSDAQVAIFLNEGAGVLDGVLLSAGYQLPVPAGATPALAALERANAIYAWLEVEQAAPVSNDVDRAVKAWGKVLDELNPNTKGPTIELGIPRNAGESYARGKTLEEAGLSDSEDAFFTRDMEF